MTIAEVLEATTVVYRKGPAVVQRGIVTEVFGYPHVDEADPAFDLIDVHFLVVGVRKDAAAELQGSLIDWLRAYPEPDRLGGGPSYIEVGAAMGSQEYAFRLFALGQSLGLWKVITPATLHIEGPDADALAGGGMVMMSGWKDEVPA